MKSRIAGIATAVLFVSGLTACDTTTEPADGGRLIGILEWRLGDPTASAAQTAPDEEAALLVPDTVQAGVPFTATVTTLGANGCWRQDGAAASVSGAIATIVPYDRIRSELDGQPIACIDMIVRLARDVELVFAEPGESIVRVDGRMIVGGDFTRSEPVTLVQKVIVE
jgi:hypothetical protein